MPGSYSTSCIAPAGARPFGACVPTSHEVGYNMPSLPRLELYETGPPRQASTGLPEATARNEETEEKRAGWIMISRMKTTVQCSGFLRSGFLLFVALMFAAVFSDATASAQGSPQNAALAQQVEAIYPEAQTLYLDLHEHPELSGHETRTAEIMAGKLRALGYEVTEHVGGTGVVAILKNGAGPVVMLRTELDALPVTEETGLPYASKVTAKDD